MSCLTMICRVEVAVYRVLEPLPRVPATVDRERVFLTSVLDLSIVDIPAKTILFFLLSGPLRVLRL